LLHKFSKRTHFFHQNSILVAKTHVYTKPMTSNRRLLPSNVRSADRCQFVPKNSHLCFCQILFELVYSWKSYYKNKKGELFIETWRILRKYSIGTVL